MKTLGNKLVNHGTLQNIGQKITKAVEVAGTLHSMYTAAKVVAPYVMRIGAAIL